MQKKQAETLCKGLGPILKRRRHSLRITQEQLAEILDTSPNQISRVERGSTTPSLSLLIQWCDALDLSLDGLFFAGQNKHGWSVDLLQKMDFLEDQDRRIIRFYIDQKLANIDKAHR